MTQRVAYTPPEPVEATERRAFTPAQRMAVMERQAGLCAMCGEPLSPGFDVDHVIPLWQGGRHEMANWEALHPDPCHKAKTARDAADRGHVRRMKAKHEGTAPPPTRRLQGPKFRGRWAKFSGADDE